MRTRNYARFAAIGIASLAVVCSLASGAARADDGPYPAKPVRIVVPASAGGASDFIVRPMATRLGELLGKPFVVDNRPGATGAIGMQAVSAAKADGYTLVFGTISNFVTNVVVNPAIPYDPVKDFAPVSIFFRSPFLLSVPVGSSTQNLQAFLERARANPGKVSYASAGNGSFGHLLTEHFSSVAKVKLLHVPYKGSAPAMTDVVSGQVDSFFDSIQSSLPFAKSHKLRVLAIGSPTRSPALPEVPTLTELGFGQVDGAAWWGLFAPAGTPPEIVNSLHRAIETALGDPKLRETLASTGANIEASSPADSARQLASDLDKYRALARTVSIAAN
ncbi:MAG: Bug family tripartite tricarboxylate transporter substrate binding protein [Burkholderiaceae bacterium]